MPQKMWKHTCPEDGRAFWMGTPLCSRCGGPGEYDGWHYRMHEAMASYQNLYGLKPIGPHRRMADELFNDVKVKCEACGGRGLHDVSEGASYERCSLCRGLRILFTRPATEIAEIRRRVLDSFPDAAADPVPEFTMVPLAYDLSQGRVMDLSTGGAESGVGAGEKDDDPWRNVSAADLAAAIDRVLIEDHEEAPPSGRAFVPIGETSLRSALLAAAPGDEHTQAAADSALEGMGEIEETLSRFTGTAHEWVVYCCVSSSMVSGCWGVFELQLGARGYLYYQPNFGVGDDESLPILGAWEPAEDLDARRACILRVYAREWRNRVLPPAMGEWATGEPELLQEAILRVLDANPEAWEAVFERLEQAPEPREAAVQTVEEVAKLSAAPVERVRQVLPLVVARDDQFEDRLWTGASSDEGRRIVVALLVHCIAKDPLL